MKQHAPRQIERRGMTITTSLCGRTNWQSKDGMNIVTTLAEVTCCFCIAKLKRTGAMK